MRWLVGEAELSIAEIAGLEKDDVVLLENNHNLTASGREVFGPAEILLGDGKNLKIIGELAHAEAAADEVIEKRAERNDNKILVRKLNSNSACQILIKGFDETEVPPPLEKFMTETEDDYKNQLTSPLEGEEQTGLTVENLTLTLRVELEARQLSLLEIENLRENQILELGIRPTDPVNLLIGNQNVGRGELVTVEDRLGVRITKLLR
ncbi:MAG: FliM/FliN family flagellar motor switch protein [Actinomycetota bacterium]